MDIPNNCILFMDTKSDGSVVSTSIRAIPYMDQDIVNVLAMGGNDQIQLQSRKHCQGRQHP